MYVPETVWENLSTDFVTGLLWTQMELAFGFVSVDRYLKMALFILCKKHQMHHMSQGYFSKKLFDSIEFLDLLHQTGIPSSYVIFWKTIWQMFDTSLNFSSTTHSHTDGQTESLTGLWTIWYIILVEKSLSNGTTHTQVEFSWPPSWKLYMGGLQNMH